MVAEQHVIIVCNSIAPRRVDEGGYELRMVVKLADKIKRGNYLPAFDLAHHFFERGTAAAACVLRIKRQDVYFGWAKLAKPLE